MFCFIFACSSLFAETHTVEQEAIRTIQQEQNRQQELFEREKYRKENELLWESFESPLIPDSDLYSQDLHSPAPNKATIESGCIMLKKVNFIGIENFPLLTRISLKRDTKKFLQHCADIQTIALLISNINKILFDKGYVTSRAHMIEQDISDGVLDVYITAGFISHYQLDNINSWQAALSLPSGLLNYYYLDYGLDNLKTLRSNQTSIKILPGEKIGESEIQVNNELGKPWYAQLTLRNEHANSRNNPTNNLNIDFENTLRSNELWTFSINESLKERSIQKNKLLSSTFLIPIRRSKLTLHISENNFLNHVEGNNIVFRTTGTTENKYFMSDYLLFKNNQNVLLAEWQISEKEDNNFINDAKIDIQSGVIEKQYIGLNYRISFSEHLKAQIKTEHHEGNFVGYDVLINQENSKSFQRKFYQGMLNYQKQAWQFGLDVYLQESNSALINTERFSLYTTFIPGIIYLPAQEGQLLAAKFAYRKQVNTFVYMPEIQLSHVKLKDDAFEAELSGIKLKGSLHRKNFSAMLEMANPIKTPQLTKDISGSMSISLSI